LGEKDDFDLQCGDGAEKEETMATNSDDGGGRQLPTSLVASLPHDSGGRTIREVRVTIGRVEVEVASRSNHNDIVSPGIDLSCVGKEVITPRGGLVANEETTTKLEDDRSRLTRGCKRGRHKKARLTSAASHRSHAPITRGGGLDQDDYPSLYTRYLVPRIGEKVELAGSQRFKNQYLRKATVKAMHG
jgi:hypothetical protein